MVGPGMFDGLIKGLLIFGILIGLGIAGLVLAFIWLAQRIDISWVGA